ncbi:OX-2 membrane glycoprotein-like [Sinocyclocheilus anshuiensis]|uniref:OX-2 membrane glycoprotein-like n=1 Tax=Sinocyclocheilus anshuiensis TaxID=1608454 RepID=UPI0007B93336|nr:PREDICTED: OX-2 membrane glycoprotein-like [Sinocyclocheilus anshuiensis]
MLCLLILILSLINRAYLSEIVAQGDTVVVFGQDASFSCTLSDASNVKQVTWQRVRDQEPVQTLATFSELFKDHVDDQYVGKVTFTAVSVNSTSIEIKNATFEDEACYICSFKVYPFQPKRQTLCLAVKGISEITASVNPALSSDPDVVVSCSATGKPTPTIHWKSAEKELNNFRLSNFTTLNKDSSTTITSNLTLPLSQFHGKYVECVAQSDSMEKSSQIYVPEVEYKVNATPRSYIITVSVLIVMAVVVIVIIVICSHTRLKRATFGIKSTYEEPLNPPKEEC